MLARILRFVGGHSAGGRVVRECASTVGVNGDRERFQFNLASLYFYPSVSLSLSLSLSLYVERASESELSHNTDP